MGNIGTEWKTVRKLGEGSFGGVYEIQRTLPDGTIEKAAMKKLSVPKSSAEIDELYAQQYQEISITAHFKNQMQELVQEYSLMQRLSNNPNIVHCQDMRTVQHTDGIGWDIYIRMELLTPLKQYLGKDYIFDEEQVIQLGLDMCNALEACHQQNIIHRDIKPENIMVADNGMFKLGDFGIAKVSEKTATGTMTGTYSYMAPEVANRQHYGASADIYSLGMVLYWLMNERTLPFLPQYPQIPTSAEHQEAQERRFSGEPLPWPLYGSRNLQRIVLKACTFVPKERYASASELKRALQALVEQNETVQSQPTVSIEKKPKEQTAQKKNPLLTIPVFGVCIAVILLLTAFFVFLVMGTVEVSKNFRTNGSQTTTISGDGAQQFFGEWYHFINLQELATNAVGTAEFIISADGMHPHWSDEVYSVRIENGKFQSIFPDGSIFETFTIQKIGDVTILKDNYGFYVSKEAIQSQKILKQIQISEKNIRQYFSLSTAFRKKTATSENLSRFTRGVYLKPIPENGYVFFGGTFSAIAAIPEHQECRTDMRANTEKNTNRDAFSEYIRNYPFFITNILEYEDGTLIERKINLQNISFSQVEGTILLLNENFIRTWTKDEYGALNGIDVFGEEHDLGDWIDGIAPGTIEVYPYEILEEAAQMQTTVSEPQETTTEPIETIPEPKDFQMKAFKQTFSIGEGKDNFNYAEEGFWGQSGIKRKQVSSIQFQNTLVDAADNAWDISADGNRTVLAWLSDGVLYVGANGSVLFPADASYLFACFPNLETVDFSDCVQTNATNYISYMFGNCPKLTTIHFGTIHTDKVIDMTGIFAGCTALKSISLTALDTKNVKSMSELFWNCKSLTSIDLSALDTAEVRDMSRMFFCCEKLSNIDVSRMDTAKVTDMTAMFNGCASIIELDVSGFKTSNVGSFGGMFSGCGSLRKISLMRFDTGKAENLGWMFSGCHSLTSLDLSVFRTDRVASFRKMFAYCENLEYVNLVGASSKYASDLTDMFLGCSKLRSIVCNDEGISLAFSNRQ